MLTGALAAIIHGAAFPVAMLIFGDITNAFVDHAVTMRVVNDPDVQVTISGYELSVDMDALTGGRVECTTTCTLVPFFGHINCDPPYNDVNFTLLSSPEISDNTSFSPDFNLTLTLEAVLKEAISDRTECLDDSDFISDINFYIYIFIGIAGGAFLAAYVQIWLFQLAEKRQVHKIRLRVYQAVLRQDIAWFDVHSAGELSSWLTE